MPSRASPTTDRSGSSISTRRRPQPGQILGESPQRAADIQTLWLAQLRHRGAHFLQEGLSHPARRCQGLGIPRARGHLEVQVERRQVMTEAVMQLAGNAQPLLEAARFRAAAAWLPPAAPFPRRRRRRAVGTRDTELRAEAQLRHSSAPRLPLPAPRSAPPPPAGRPSSCSSPASTGCSICAAAWLDCATSLEARRYSARKDTAGSTRVARSAGTQLARAAEASTTTAVAAKVTGSVLLTP